MTLLATDEVIWVPFWVLIGFVFVCERMITAWSGCWPARFLAALLIPELRYALFLHAVFVKCLFDITVGRDTTWGHVQHSAPAAEESVGDG